jgi:hypothetical protein
MKYIESDESDLLRRGRAILSMKRDKARPCHSRVPLIHAAQRTTRYKAWS